MRGYRTLLLLAAAWGLVPFAGEATFAQTSMEGGPRVAAMGGAGVALPGDAWGVANPASWSTVSGSAVGFFATQAFNLPEMRLMAAHYVQPTPLATLAVGARTFGFDAYRTSRFSLGLARTLSLDDTRSLHAALSVTYVHLNVADYGNAGTLGLSVGVLAQITPELYGGAHASNLNRPTLGTQEGLPRHLAIGLGYLPAPQVRIAADLVKDVRFPLSVRAGIEGQLVETVTLRVGVATEPVRFTTGAALRVGALSAEFAAEQHEVLGWSPAVGINLDW